VHGVAHPLIKNSGRKLLVQAKLQINLRIEGLPWTTEEPPVPVGILLAQLFYFGAAAPTFHVHRPLLLDLDDFSDAPSPQNVAHSKRIRLATVLRSHLNNLSR